MSNVDLKRILAIALIMFGHQLYGVDQIILGTVLVNIMEDISIPLFLGGVIVTLFGAGVVVSSILAGLIIKQKAFGFAISAGILIFSLFTFLTGFASSAWEISFYRIGVGVGEGLWSVTYYSIMGTLFAKRRGLANAIAGNMYILGFLWSYPLIAAILAWSGSWRLPFHVFGLLGFITLALIVSLVKPVALKQSGPLAVIKREEPRSSILRNRNVILSCFMGIFFSFIFYSVAGLYPTYLRTVLGYDPVSSGILMSMQNWSALVTAPLILFLSDDHGRKPFMYFLSLFSAFIIYFLFHLTPGDFIFAAIVCIIYGTGAVTYPLTLALVQDSVSTETITYATSIFSSSFYAGAAVAGLSTGYVVSMLGWELASFWLIACCIAFFLVTVMARETRGRK